MNKLLKTSLGIALACTTIFASNPALAYCKKLSDTKIQRRIQGNWHIAHTFDRDNKHCDVHVSFTRTSNHNGTFESYASVTEDAHANENQDQNEDENENEIHMITINGDYKISAGDIKANITSSNLPIEGQQKSYHVVCLNKQTLTINDGEKDISFNKE